MNNHSALSGCAPEVEASGEVCWVALGFSSERREGYATREIGKTRDSTSDLGTTVSGHRRNLCERGTGEDAGVHSWKERPSRERLDHSVHLLDAGNDQGFDAQLPGEVPGGDLRRDQEVLGHGR